MNVPHFKQELDYSCLPACLRMVLAFYNQEFPESELRILLKTRPGGTSPLQVTWRLPELGYEAVMQSGSQSTLRETLAAERPCIVHVWTQPLSYWPEEAIHSLVVVELSEDYVLVHDPILSSGPTSVPLEAFRRAWAATDNLMIAVQPRKQESA